MIAEIGHFALILAFTMALVQGSLPLVGAHRGKVGWMALGAPAALLQFGFVALAFSCLLHGYLTSDFSIVNVYQNSHSDKPLLYKVTGLWGNHEGSLLLWISILSLFGAVLAAFGGNLPLELKSRALAVQGLVGVGFLAFILLTSNPFERQFPVPLDGRGLNPILQDPGLAFHPPFLYLGYVGFSMAFSFAIAALLEGRLDPAWARWVRPWTLAAWCFLTIGIALGSWWAYYELGWGGWWFWDPVENASLMPWLAGTALLHSAIVVEKRDALKVWTVLLAILAFSLSLLGTFIVRSGVITSVHSFASDPGRGLFILGFLVAVIGGSLTLYAVRAPVLKQGGVFKPISREGALVLNNLLLTTVTATVLIGTLYPLFLDALSGQKVSVGPPFYNATFMPIMMPLVLAMAVGPFMPWKKADLGAAMGRLKLVAVLSILAAAAFWWQMGSDNMLTILGMTLAVWLAVGTVAELSDRIKLGRAPLSESLRRARGLPGSAWGMTVSHFGVALVIMGMAGVNAWQVEKIQAIHIGETVQAGPYAYKLVDVKPVQGPNYSAIQGTFEVYVDGELEAVLNPETRKYTAPPMETTEAAINPTFSSDMYAVVGERQSNGAWATRVYHKPLVTWLWIGAGIMVLGGFFSLMDRRLRIGVPDKQRAQATKAPAQAAS